MRGIWTLAVTLQGPCHDADAVVDLAVPVRWPAGDWGTNPAAPQAKGSRYFGLAK